MLLPYSSSDIYTGSMKWNDKSAAKGTIRRLDKSLGDLTIEMGMSGLVD